MLFTFSAARWQLCIFMSRHRHKALSAWKSAVQCRYGMPETEKYKYGSLIFPIIPHSKSRTYSIMLFSLNAVSRPCSSWRREEELRLLKKRLHYGRMSNSRVRRVLGLEWTMEWNGASSSSSPSSVGKSNDCNLEIDLHIYGASRRATDFAC